MATRLRTDPLAAVTELPSQRCRAHRPDPVVAACGRPHLPGVDRRRGDRAVLPRRHRAGGDMKLVVTGSRTWDDAEYIWRILDQHLNAELGIALHHGACPKGADQIADQWATQRKLQGRPVRMRRWPAQWRDENGVYDPRAGFRRNTDMVKLIASWQGWGRPPKCLAFIRDHSAGATHCANEAARAGIEVIRYRWEDRSGQLNLLDLIGATS